MTKNLHPTDCVVNLEGDSINYVHDNSLSNLDVSNNGWYVANYATMLEVYCAMGFYLNHRLVAADSFSRYEVHATVAVGNDNAYDYDHVVTMLVAQTHPIFTLMVAIVRDVHVSGVG